MRHHGPLDGARANVPTGEREGSGDPRRDLRGEAHARMANARLPARGRENLRHEACHVVGIRCGTCAPPRPEPDVARHHTDPRPQTASITIIALGAPPHVSCCNASLRSRAICLPAACAACGPRWLPTSRKRTNLVSTLKMRSIVSPNPSNVKKESHLECGVQPFSPDPDEPGANARIRSFLHFAARTESQTRDGH